MKCKICGAESGKYSLCRACNIKKEKGEITATACCKELGISRSKWYSLCKGA